MISLFIPVYNERNIKDNLDLVYNKMKQITNDFEVIVVDDGSTEFFPIYNGIRYFKYDKPSRRENLAKSFYYGKGDIIAFIDADLSVDLSYLKQLFSEIDNFDIAIGSRYIDGAIVKRELFRKIISGVYNTFIRTFFDSDILDHQCGFKAFKKSVLLDLVDELGYDYSYNRGWFWDAELLIKAQKKGYKIKEFPIKWVRSDNSSFDWKRELRMIRYILRRKK
jgi:glycosyltransferase involved in cell wall biosynthesis